MGLIKVEDGLPEIGKDVICFGIDEDGETKVEEGFRSEVDNPDKPHNWADFSYTVTHWVYSPEIEIEENNHTRECGCIINIHGELIEICHYHKVTTG